jgi:hypothetical protein
VTGEAERDVSVAHWDLPPEHLRVAEARRALAAFARDHGMDAAGRRSLDPAVDEATADAVRRGHRDGPRGGIVIDAATDGVDLSVRVVDLGADAIELDGPGVRTLTGLCDRIEVWAGAPGDGTSVLMEFSMCASRRPEPHLPAAPDDAIAAGGQAGAGWSPTRRSRGGPDVA